MLARRPPAGEPASRPWTPLAPPTILTDAMETRRTSLLRPLALSAGLLAVVVVLQPVGAGGATQDPGQWRRYNGWEVTSFTVTGAPADLQAELVRGLKYTGRRRVLRTRERPAFAANGLLEDMRRVRDWGIVAFDGGPLRGISYEVEPADFLRVIFSGAGSGADTVLEDLIQKNTAPRRLVVVSSDIRLKKAARRRRAQSLTSPEFLMQMVRRMSAPVRRPPEPREKRQGVESGQLDKWLDLFGIEGGDEFDVNDRIKF